MADVKLNLETGGFDEAIDKLKSISTLLEVGIAAAVVAAGDAAVPRARGAVRDPGCAVHHEAPEDRKSVV